MTQDAAARNIRYGIANFIAINDNPDASTEVIEAEASKLYNSPSIETWLLDALGRVESSGTGRNPIRLATHTIKPIHPSIDKADNLLVTRYPFRNDESSLATHSIESISDFKLDVTGNAAHGLKRFKFGSLEIGGKFLVELACDRDARLHEALELDDHEREKIVKLLAELASPVCRTHSRAKQLYWLVGDEPSANEDFHLLAPLYATSLAHRVFQTINDDRFSDDAKAARDARRKDHPSEQGYADYPTLAVQRFGGSKPQNISQLNSERGGNSYLLGAAPPVWRSRTVSPIYAASAFPVYGRRIAVGPILRGLGDFLATDPRRNMHTRDYRDQLTCALVDELIVFTVEMHQLPTGWSSDWECRLSFEQQCWLDPHRAEHDAEFAKRLIDTDWLGPVCADFSRWLTGRLERYWKISMGDPEHRHFSREAARDETVKNVFENEYANWRAKLVTELEGLKEVLDDDDE